MSRRSFLEGRASQAGDSLKTIRPVAELLDLLGDHARLVALLQAEIARCEGVIVAAGELLPRAACIDPADCSSPTDCLLRCGCLNVDQSPERMAQLLGALGSAEEWISRVPHGDNCYLLDRGEYNACFCGKESLSAYLVEVIEGSPCRGWIASDATLISTPTHGRPVMPLSTLASALNMHYAGPEWPDHQPLDDYSWLGPEVGF